MSSLHLVQCIGHNEGLLQFYKYWGGECKKKLSFPFLTLRALYQHHPCLLFWFLKRLLLLSVHCLAIKICTQKLVLEFLNPSCPLSHKSQMHLQTQSLTTNLPLPSLFLPKPSTTKPHQFTPLKQQKPFPQFSLKCSLSTVSAEPPAHVVGSSNDKPFPAEVSRTIMELSSVGTLSTLTPDGWPLSVGVRFAVDDDGIPILCLSDSYRQFSVDRRSSLHVQLEQSGMRTPQCTIQGSLDKPEDTKLLKWAHSMWKKRFGEEVKDELIYVVAMERVLQMEDFMEDGVWVSSSDYKNASPDPLRDFAEAFVNEINDKNMEDVSRFCNVYVDLGVQVSEAKMIWVDRLGFDMRLWSPQKGTFDVRIPFPREVTDVKGAKSSFNGMSQLAWEVEKNYQTLNFKKVQQLKQITHKGL